METTEAKNDVGGRGREVYRRLFASLTETPENIGKIVAIEPDSGDYEIDADVLQAARRLKSRHPDARLWSQRIGYNVVYSLGGAIYRVNAAGEAIDK